MQVQEMEEATIASKNACYSAHTFPVKAEKQMEAVADRHFGQ